MKTGRVLAILGGGLLALGCLKPAKTAAGGTDSPWVHINSAHFTVISDLPESEAARVAAGFEQVYETLGSVVLPGASLPDVQTNAVIFAQQRDLREFVGDGFGGQYRPSLPNDLEATPTVIAVGTLSPWARLAFTHELVHRFNHVGLGPTPTWLNEGLADYYSTLRSDEGKPVLGENDPRYMCVPDGLGNLECGEYEKLPGNHLPSASQLIALDADAFYNRAENEDGSATWQQKRRRSQNYGTAWLFVHMLMHGKQDYARRFREALAQPAAVSKGAKVADVINRVPSAELDRDLAAYLKVRQPWRQHHAALPPAPEGLSSRALSEGEALVWLARLDSFEGQSSKRALARLNRAGELTAGEGNAGDASFWLGRYNQLRGNFDQAVTRYRQAIEMAPDNPEYVYGLLTLYWGDERMMAAGREGSSPVARTIAVLTPIARSPQQLNALAAYQAMTSDVAGALASSERACRAGPNCWACFHNRALVLYSASRVSEALEAQRAAQARQTEHTPPELVALVGEALAFYTAAAADPAAVEGRKRPSLFAP